jgi:hypothetical protein
MAGQAKMPSLSRLQMGLTSRASRSTRACAPGRQAKELKQHAGSSQFTDAVRAAWPDDDELSKFRREAAYFLFGTDKHACNWVSAGHQFSCLAGALGTCLTSTGVLTCAEAAVRRRQGQEREGV